MLKENYFNRDNSIEKIKLWQTEFSGFSKKFKKFSVIDSALIVIDMQNFFLDEKSHAFVPSSEIIVNHINRLISFYDKKNLPVIFTYFAVAPGDDDPILRRWGNSVSENSYNSIIPESVLRNSNHKVIRKNTYDSFYRTNLEKALNALNVKQLVITGVLTNLCCETTARSAFVRNFDVFIGIDCTAAFNEEMHVASLRNLMYGFASPVTINEITT